ncbi:venom prothrombin activator pseutarin-C non-catalytic subunit [Exaiptasia diaphana]|uniref:F5/8 type C domain-containing protein n=1 Tax=Exaiptasia diaphana TaxID=2652724 RepID=A0A913X7Z0_EXADI|nr:venom prothrombin activator pseutarin-C non-catalytic subunit [Exaiptasia diaphana]
MELYECKGDEGVCSYALGMESRMIKDKQITASTTYSKYSPSWGRLNSGNGGWWAVGGDKNPWLQIDLLEIKMINGIATQGNWNHFAKEYHLEYRNATKNDLIKYTTNKVKVFQANSDGSSIVYNAIDPPIIAQIVRIVPKYEDHMTMRAELYGCPYMGSYDGSK